MSKKSKTLRTGISLAVVTTMLVGIIQCLPGVTLEAHAATSAPTTTSYVTKSQLMTEFDTDPNTQDKVDMKILYSGRDQDTDSDGVADRKSWTPWMIAGTDSGVQGDNIVIFNYLGTVSILEEGVIHTSLGAYRENSDGSNITYDSSWGCTYAAEPTEVAANHYGSSDIRNALNSIPVKSEWFNDKDDSLINQTPITSEDILNNCTYTTRDYCYMPTLKNSKLYGGGSNNLFVDTSYIGEKTIFFTRTAGNSNSTISGINGMTDTLSIFDNLSLTRSITGYYYLLNINLSSVKFASVIPTPCSVIISDASIAECGGKGVPNYVLDYIANDNNTGSLYLRLDGSSSISSTAEYNSSMIKVVPKSTDSGLVLLVQGNDGTSDWYYRKEISGTTAVTVTADTIKTVAGLSETPDLSNCIVWIEKIDEYFYAYAKDATAVSHICYSATLTEQAKVEPKCTVDGTEKHWKCSCNKIYDDDTATVQLAAPTSIAQTGHSMAEATCTAPSTCSNSCGYTEGTAKGHSYATTWSKNETKHWHAATCEHTAEVSDEADHSFGVNNICTICDYDKNNYNIIEGADGEWTQGTTNDLVIKGDGEFAKFSAVKVDGATINAANYEVSEGSTIVTLKATYVAGLAVGAHTFAIEWTDGVATTTFEIKAKPVSQPTTSGNTPAASNEKDEVPKTGENDNMLFWIFVTAISGCGIIFAGKKYSEK